MRPQWGLRGLRFVAACVAAAASFAAAPAAAEDGPYVRIEEDWELVLNTPDTEVTSPQLMIAMRPASTSQYTGLLLINYADMPVFDPGGGQVQLWKQGACAGYSDFVRPPLTYTNETVTWTQYMKRQDGKMTFGVKKADGESWGHLDETTLGAPIVSPDSISAFNNYSSQVSAESLTINFGSERIKTLKLKAVRKYRSHTDTTPVTEGERLVYPAQ